MNPITEIFVKEEEVFHEETDAGYQQEPPTNPQAQPQNPLQLQPQYQFEPQTQPQLESEPSETALSKSNQFFEVLIKESDYVEAQNDLAVIIQIDSDVECISINSDSSEDIELLSYAPPAPPTLPRPPLSNVQLPLSPTPLLNVPVPLTPLPPSPPKIPLTLPSPPLSTLPLILPTIPPPVPPILAAEPPILPDSAIPSETPTSLSPPSPPLVPPPSLVPPAPLIPSTPFVPSVFNVRTLDSWDAPIVSESLDASTIVSESPVDPLSPQISDPYAAELIRLSQAAKPIDYFNLFATEDLYTMIVNETNKYGTKLTADVTSPYSRMKNFRELTVPEFKRFLGLMYHMGNIKVNQASNYWMVGKYFQIRIFGETMVRNRFYQIMRSLYFSDDKNSKSDCLSKIRPMMDYFNNRMQIAHYFIKEFRKESLALLRAKLVYNQYMNAKKGKCEIKMYMLIEPSSSLVLKFLVLGKNDVIASQASELDIIKGLLEDRLPTTTNSVDLVTEDTKWNKRKRTMDSLDGNMKRLKTDETQEDSSDDTEYSFEWEDTEDAFGLSLEYDDEIASKNSADKKKLADSSWKSCCYISRVNLKDRMTTFYACEKESVPSHVKIGLHILQLLMLNAYALYRKYRTGKTSYLRFRMSIIQELIGEYLPTPYDGPMATNSDSIHLPVHCPRSDRKRVLKRQCVQCKLLKGKRIESIFMCPLCPEEPGLCLENCFRDYHNYV